MSQLPSEYTGDSPTSAANEALGQQLSTFLAISPLPALITESNKLVGVNPLFCELSGYSAGNLLNKEISEFLVFEGIDGWEDLSPEGAQCEILSANGKALPSEVFARSLPAGRRLFLVNDTSQRVATERSFLSSERRRWRAQKEAGLELLAGGIAHDFNNVLAVILLQTELLQVQLKGNEPLLHRVAEIRTVSDGAAGIVKQLLAFSQKQAMRPTPVVLNEMIEASAPKFREIVGDKIRLDLSLDRALGVCFVDQNQVLQALVYLVSNANQATPAGGRLRIETKNVVVDSASSPRALAAGSYVEISISDSGIGMDPKTREQIFEPFYSTRDSDKSAGLGLAAVYGIVKQQGGFIWVESQLGHGTTFKIKFPRVDQPEIVQPTSEAASTQTQGSKTILLVDDEARIRKVTGEILRRAGFTVLEAASGLDALAIVKDSSGKIDLLLTDYLMPYMGGEATANAVNALYPETLRLYMSGQQVYLGENDPKRDHFLSKPFSAEELLLKVNAILRG